MADLTKTTINYVSPERLGYYDGKLKAWVKAADDAVKADLQEKINAANAAVEAEALRAQGVEATNAAAAQAAQNAADKAQSDVNALAGKVGEVAEGKTVMGIINEIQENAYDDTEIRGLISGLDETKADKEQVVKDIAAAVKVETDARVEAVAGVQGAVDALAGTHATDKAALEAAIALKADKTALEAEAATARAAEEANAAAIKVIADDYLKAADKAELVDDIEAVEAVANAAATKEAFDAAVEALEAEDARIVGLVEAEAAKAREEEGKLDARLVEVETFFKTAEDETLDTALDTLVEIQKYLDGEGAVADQMLLDIAANKKAIEDHVATDHDFAAADEALEEALMAEIAKKEDKTVVAALDARVEVVEGKVATLEGEMDAAEGRLDAVEAAVATKAEAQALADAVEALEGADADQVERIEALEAKFEGEASVENKIATAKQEAIDAAAADATSKADAAEEAAKGHAESLNTAMNTRVAELEAINHEAYIAADTELQSTLNAAIELKANASTVSDMDTAYKAADAAMQARLDVLEAVEHVEITEAAIDEMFA